MITVDQALDVVLKSVTALPTESVPVTDALGRVLAQSVEADMDLPPFDRSRMDGYALRSADAHLTPVTLRVLGSIAAGAAFDGTVGPGEAVKIFTGAPLPHGADAVQKVEATESDAQSVIIKEPVKPGQFVTPRASEVHASDVVLNSGRVIGAAEMAVLASFGCERVIVGARPRVSVISTGSELVEVSARPTGSQIRNSNTYSILAYAERAGATVKGLGMVPDSLDETRRALLKASEAGDIVITSGGVSMGDYDLVKAALVDLGAEVYFDKVAIRPGKPTVFARRGETCYFGLPGNPVSTAVTFNVFVWPAIRRMQGDPAPNLPTTRAELAQSIRDASSRRSYLPGRLSIRNGRAIVESLRWGGSSDFVAFIEANALIVVGEDTHDIEAGQMVEVLSLNPL